MNGSTYLIAALLLSAAPAFADTCTTQTPPAPQSNMGPASPCGSLPPGEATARFPTFGGALSVTQVGPGGERAPQRDLQPQAATPDTLPVLRGAE